MTTVGPYTVDTGVFVNYTGPCYNNIPSSQISIFHHEDTSVIKLNDLYASDDHSLRFVLKNLAPFSKMPQKLKKKLIKVAKIPQISQEKSHKISRILKTSTLSVTFLV